MFKKIKARIETLHLDEVTEALEELGIKGVTITKCKNFDPQIGPALFFRGKKQVGDFRSEIRLEMVVGQELVGKVVESIQKVGGAGWDNGGKISVLSIKEVISIEASECAEYPGLGMVT